MEDITTRLDLLPRTSRILFAAACAQHVLPVYMRSVHVVHSAVRRSLDMAWAVAEGRSISTKELADLDRTLDQARPNPERDGPGVFPEFWATGAVSAALGVAIDGTSKTAQHAAYDAQNAVESFALEPEPAAEEEEAWQLEALALVERAAPDGTRTAVFESMLAEKPKWLVSFEEDAGI